MLRPPLPHRLPAGARWQVPCDWREPPPRQRKALSAGLSPADPAPAPWPSALKVRPCCSYRCFLRGYRQHQLGLERVALACLQAHHLAVIRKDDAVAGVHRSLDEIVDVWAGAGADFASDGLLLLALAPAAWDGQIHPHGHAQGALHHADAGRLHLLLRNEPDVGLVAAGLGRGEGDARAGHARPGLGDGGAEDGDGEGGHRPTSCRSISAVYLTSVRCLSRFWPCGARAAHFCNSSQEAAGALDGAAAPAQLREETPLATYGFSAEAARAARDRMRLSMVALLQLQQSGPQHQQPPAHPLPAPVDGEEAHPHAVEEQFRGRATEAFKAMDLDHQ